MLTDFRNIFLKNKTFVLIHNVISFEDRKRTYQENKEENVEIKSLKES